MKNLLLVISGALTLALVLVVTGAWLHSRSDIPANIASQVSFTILYPKAKNGFVLDQKTFKYDPSLKQLSFIVKFQNRTITFAEQTSPDQFRDIPEYYPKLIEKMNGYTSFENSVGRVDLTRPAEVKTEVAVMNSKGTLLFAKSDGDISSDGWRRLFNSLAIKQPN